MTFKILDKTHIDKYLKKINYIAYSDAFAKFAQAAYGSRRFFVGVYEEDDLKAFFPVFEKKQHGQKVSEIPLFIYTEVYFVDSKYQVDGKDLGNKVLAFLKSDVLRMNVYNFEGSDNFKHDGFENIFSAMITDLSASKNYNDYLKNVLSKNSRSKITKSYSVGLELVNLKSSNLHEFHELYFEHVKSLGSKPHPVEYFKSMLNSYDFGKDLFMMAAKHKDHLISANLFVVNKDYMEVRFLADDVNSRNLYPNNFLYAEMLKWSFANGIKYIDFGGIPKKMRANIEFKMSFGAKEYPIYTKYFFKNTIQKVIFHVNRRMLYLKKYRGLMLKKIIKHTTRNIKH